jgi:transposase
MNAVGIAAQLPIRPHPLAKNILSIPGFGPLLADEFLVHSNGMREYTSAAKLAAHAGLTPIAHETGTTLNGLRRPSRYHRGLRRVFWYSAFVAIRYCPASKALYQRKRTKATPPASHTRTSQPPRRRPLGTDPRQHHLRSQIET